MAVLEVVSCVFVCVFCVCVFCFVVVVVFYSKVLVDQIYKRRKMVKI